MERVSSYSNLHSHSYYSIQDGFSSPKEYLVRGKAISLKSLAMTEHGNFYSSVYMAKLQKDFPEIKVLYGVEFYEAFDVNVKDKDAKYFHLVALAKTARGRIALNELVTKSEENKYFGKPRVDLNMMKEYGEDLIVLSACMASKLHREKDFDKCVEYVNEYKSVFPYFYLEMQSHKSDDQVEYNRKLLRLSEVTNTPFVITTDSHAATEEDLYYQGIFVQIAHDAETASESYESCYLQDCNTIYDIMIPQIGEDNVTIGLTNTNIISDMCEEIKDFFKDPILPPCPIPEGETYRSYIEKLCNEGWKKRKFDLLDDEAQKIRRERMNYELDVIDSMGFIGYFLVVEEFIGWARNNDVLVGDGGRGSCAGSMVAYLLGISGVDPIKYGLIFERFLNPERQSLPE